MKIADTNGISNKLESVQMPRGIKKSMGTATEMDFTFTTCKPRMHHFAERWDTTVVPPVKHPESNVLVMDGHIGNSKVVDTLIFGGNYSRWFPQVDLSDPDKVMESWNDNYGDVDGLKFRIEDGKLTASVLKGSSTTKQQWGEPPF